MGLGRVHDKGLVALPGRGTERGADQQLVEPLCAVRGPQQPREAITSRPLLLCAVGRVIASGRQVTLRLTSTHGEAARAQALLTNLSLFLSGLKNAAEQLSPGQCWERIWARILAP